MAGPPPELTADAAALHDRTFGTAPAILAFAPGRVNLIGEHIDYSGGLVLPAAIDRWTVAAASLEPSASGRPRLRAVSAWTPADPLETPLSTLTSNDPTINTGWTAYVRGVVAGCLHAAAAHGPHTNADIRLAIVGNVPVGAGLSSSASLEVAVALAILALTNTSLPPLAIARLCREAEHLYAGVPCGLMDQYTAAMAVQNSALLIDCWAATHRAIPIPQDLRIIIVDSGVKHTLASSAYADRRAACERALIAIQRTAGPRPTLRHCTPEDLASAAPTMDPTDLRRARHAITECRRTLDAAAALEAGDLPVLGDLMLASHESLRTDYQVSCPELDDLAAAARTIPGIHGARMTGAGFGGCIVALADADRAEAAARTLSDGGRCFCMVTDAVGAGGTLSPESHAPRP